MSASDTRDTADLIGADAPDPEPVEITNPNHPDHVDPDPNATPIREEEPR